MNNIKKITIVVFVLMILAIGKAQAEDTDINLTIRSGDTIIFSGTTPLPSSDLVTINDSDNNPHEINAKSVLSVINNADIASDSFVISDLKFFSSFNSLYLNCITNSQEEFCDDWQYVVNDSYPFSSMDQNILSGGENIYLYFGPQNKISLSSNSINTGQDIVVTIESYNYQENTWTARTGVTVGLTQPDPNNPWSPTEITTSLVDQNGQAFFFSIPEGIYNIGVKEDFYFPTEQLSVTTKTENIILKIYANDTALFNAPIDVKACADSTSADASITLNGKCAVEQSGLSNTWTWDYAPSGWLDELGGYATTPDFSKFWSWFNDLNLGETGLNQHILSPGEELLLTYDSYPLRISASGVSGKIGDSIMFTVEEKSTFDSNYNMIWTSSLGATVTLGTQSCATTTDGTCSIVLDSTGSLDAITSKISYVPSTKINIEVSNATGGGGNNSSQPTFNVEDAMSYLKSKQDPSGSFALSDLYTDWVAVAYGAGNVTGNSRDSILEYLSSTNTISSLITDNERRVLALLSLGQNPYSFHGVNYVNAIIKDFDGAQFGDSNLVNDDIFALISLFGSGYTKGDDVISKSIAFVISKQKTNGSWAESIDTTAAGIQALQLFKSASGVSSSLSKAETYLKDMQNSDGGWGNIFSTSWAIQAESALGKTWTKNGKNGLDYLATQQKNSTNNGALLPASDIIQNIIWATSYAIPAGLGKPWGEIMQSVSKPTDETEQNNSVNTSPDTEVVNDTEEVNDTDEVNQELSEENTNPEVITTNLVVKQVNINNLPKIPNTIKKEEDTIVEQDTITPEMLTASTINSLPTDKSSKKLPIVLGTISGICLLYALFKILQSKKLT